MEDANQFLALIACGNSLSEFVTDESGCFGG